MSGTQEIYVPAPIGVNGTYKAPSGSPMSTAIFVCITTGNLTITRADGSAVLSAFPVTAGGYTYIPFFLGAEFSVVLAGGASGTLGVC